MSSTLPVSLTVCAAALLAVPIVAPGRGRARGRGRGAYVGRWGAAGGTSRAGRRPGSTGRAGWAGGLVVLGLAVTGVVSGPALGHLVLGWLGLLGVGWLRGRATTRAAHERAALGAGRACELLVGEVGVGVPPTTALRRVAEQHPSLAAVVAAADVGGDVPSALRRLAAGTGVTTWSRVADAWQVCERSGAALGPVLARVAQAERDETARRRLVRTELADVVATARLMAALPWLLVGLASLGGGTGVTFLLTTWPGFVCAALGAGLVAGGLVWIERISSEGMRT